MGNIGVLLPEGILITGDRTLYVYSEDECCHSNVGRWGSLVSDPSPGACAGHGIRKIFNSNEYACAYTCKRLDKLALTVNAS